MPSDLTRPSPQSRLRPLYWVLSLILAGVLVYFSVRGIEWSRVGQIVLTARPGWVAVTCLISSVSILLRALRWRVLLLAEGDVALSTAFWATSAGYFGNNFLPARAGELVRSFMISATSGLSNAYVLTTALSERVADAIALVMISSAVLLGLPATPGWLGHAARPFGILGLCGVICIAVLPRLERVWHWLLSRAPVPPAIRGKLEHILEQALLGIRSFHDAGRLVRFLGLTAVIWIGEASATVTAGHAVGLSISFTAAFLLIAGLGLGSALPSTPGYVGIYQFVAVGVLGQFGFSRTEAIAYILFAQALQYVLITVFGVIGFLRYRKMRGHIRVAHAG